MIPTMDDPPLLSPEAVRALYRLGLELKPSDRVTLTLSKTSGGEIVLVLRNASGGLLEITCADEVARTTLRTLVGFDVVAHGAAQGSGESGNRGCWRGARR